MMANTVCCTRVSCADAHRSAMKANPKTGESAHNATCDIYHARVNVAHSTSATMSYTVGGDITDVGGWLYCCSE